MGIGIFGGGNTRNETKNLFSIDERTYTTNANQTSGSQADNGGVSASNSILDLSNRSTSTSNTNITSLDGGAIDNAARVTMSVVETGAARDRQIVESMGSLSGKVIDGAFSALKTLGERIMGTADSATQSAYSLAGQGMRTVGDAKAPEAAITKTALYVAGGLGIAVVVAMIFSRGKK